jgi:hypothetical protein
MLSLALRRWRDRRRERSIERQESQVVARTTLRDFKKWTGAEGGPMGGGASACHACERCRLGG